MLPSEMGEAEKDNIQKTKITASGPIISWQIDGGPVETVADFILGGSKITADSDCSNEIKRPLLLECTVPWSVYDQTRDQCIISNLISA